jgi:hypothetical protein
MAEPFADIASITAELIATPVGDIERVGIATPDDLTNRLPFARATRTGGPRDRLNDRARIAIDVFDDDYERGQACAQDIADYLEPGRLRLRNVLIDRVDIDQAPLELPPWAPGIFRFEARYTIVSRRPFAA